MKLAILLLVISISAIWLWREFVTPQYRYTIKGVVQEKSSNVIKIKDGAGAIHEIPNTEFEVGQNISVSVYQSKLTGKTKYRYFTIKAFSPAG